MLVMAEILTAVLNSDYDYQLFVDADVEFEPDVIGRMILSKKIYCCPYRKKLKTTL